MARIVQLKWTELQREIAAVAAQGKSFDNLVQSGYTKSLVSKVLNAIKSGQRPPGEGQPRTGEQEAPDSHKTTQRAGLQTGPLTVGRITITPENWGFTQYGAILVLDTYNKARRDINYGGTIGDFLCDITEFYRRIVNYKEVDHGRAISEGRGGIEEDGGSSSEPAQVGKA